MKRAKRSCRGRGDNSNSGKGESQRASSMVLPLLRRFGRENVEKVRVKERMKTINFGGRYGLLAGNFGGRKESGLGCGCARLKRVAEQNPSRLDMDGLCLGRPNGAVVGAL